MTIRRFLIPSLFAVGFGSHDPAQAAFTHVTTTGLDDPNTGTLFKLFRQDHGVTLAQHRSHSSHRSHRSHSSHRSGAGGYSPYYAPPPPPVYAPPPPPLYAPASPAPPPRPSTTRPRATPPRGSASPRDSLLSPVPDPGPARTSRAAPPAGDALPALSGRSQRFAAIVRRVQIALLGQGYFNGPITGTVGPATRGAIRRFQQARGLSQTGTITPELLDALMVASE